jgi:hypothetical protein
MKSLLPPAVAKYCFDRGCVKSLLPLAAAKDFLYNPIIL